MIIERIRIPTGLAYRNGGAEKLVRDERKTELSDAVALDPERKQNQQQNHEHSEQDPQEDASVFDKAEGKERGALNVVA